MNTKKQQVPGIMRQGRLVPWLYLLPALLVMTTLIVYPGLNTFYLSLRNNANTDWASDNCLSGAPCWGVFENYRYALASEIMQTAFLNNLKWILIMVSGAVMLGLLIAVLADRVRYEALANTLGFTSDIGDTIPGGFGKAEWTAIVSYVNGGDLDAALDAAEKVQAEALK